jgi:hypothetical protein
LHLLSFIERLPSNVQVFFKDSLIKCFTLIEFQMKKIAYLFSLVCLSGWMVSCDQQAGGAFNEEMANQSLAFADEQYNRLYQDLETNERFPRSLNEDGSIRMVPPRDWTSGFFPGSMWYLYEVTGKEEWKERAEAFTNNLEELKNYTGTHDLGFMMYNSFGHGLRLAGIKEYEDILVKGAESLASRYNPTVGAIRSWDHNEDKWQYPVIIDNMMNLEYLFWAAMATDSAYFREISVNHAVTTINNHFRADNSTYHVVNFDTLTGEVISRQTHQGYSDESAWARGQAWGLYGFTMTYRETKNEDFLNQAVLIADFILNHPNLPDDMVPYWDFDAPGIPDEPRDASAAAITGSALLELSQYMDVEKEQTYFEAAKHILSSLSSPDYMAQPNENGNFILKHSVGNKPADSEVDVPINYADYYFIEALIRYLDIVSD